MMPPQLPPPEEPEEDPRITNRPPADEHGAYEHHADATPGGMERREELIDRIRQPALGWWDYQFKRTSTVLLVIAALFCGASCIGLALGICGLVYCRDPVAKQKAQLFMFLAVVGLIGRLLLVSLTELGPQSNR